MSLPKPTKQSSIDGACLSPPIGEVTKDISRLQASTAVLPHGHLVALWHREASPISSSSACSTPLEKQPGDVIALGADLGLLAIADCDDVFHVVRADGEQSQDDYADTFARVGTVNGLSESQSGEEDDEVDEWYQPKGGPSTPTPHKPSVKPIPTSAVGKPPKN